MSTFRTLVSILALFSLPSPHSSLASFFLPPSLSFAPSLCVELKIFSVSTVLLHSVMVVPGKINYKCAD